MHRHQIGVVVVVVVVVAPTQCRLKPTRCEAKLSESLTLHLTLFRLCRTNRAFSFTPLNQYQRTYGNVMQSLHLENQNELWHFCVYGLFDLFIHHDLQIQIQIQCSFSDGSLVWCSSFKQLSSNSTTIA